MRQITLCSVVVLFTATCFKCSNAATCYEKGGFTQADWPHCFQASSDVLAYSGMQGTTQMRLGMWVEGHTGGWSSLAMSSNGGMKGSREIVVRKNDAGTWIAEDRYSSDYVEPQLTISQDVELLSAEEVNGGTAWSVLLPLNACKADEDGYPANFPLDEDFARIMLWARGAAHTFSYHSANRGTFRANLVSGPPTSTPDLTGMLRVDALMPNVAVEIGPNGHDSRNPYICGIFDLTVLAPGKDINQLHHVAQFEATLSPASAQYVHHMILYLCDNGMVEMQGLGHNSVVKDCESMPRGCYAMRYPWAVGGGPMTFPSDVGMPIGMGIKYVALQMHYYNPNQDANIVDNSGVTITIADTLRAQHANIFEMNGGTSDDNRDLMPAGEKDVQLDFFIPKECTQQWDDDEVTIVGTGYHAHLLGTRINVDVIRDGAYLGPIRRENRYDFNHQSIEPGPITKVKRGDAVKMTCQYDTRSVSEPVHFGDLTQTEMCWAAFVYYPHQSITSAHYENKWDPRVECGDHAARYKDITEPSAPAPACQVVGCGWCKAPIPTTTQTTTPGNASTAAPLGTSSNTWRCACALFAISVFMRFFDDM